MKALFLLLLLCAAPAYAQAVEPPGPWVVDLRGATAADVALMRRVVGSEMGVKAAGGVKDFAALEAMVKAGATRIGASAGVRIVQQASGGAVTTAAGTGY